MKERVTGYILTNEDRKQILTSVLETIKGISNKESQMRVWVRGEGPECYDFDEASCDLFGDGDPILDNYKDFGITEEQYHILKKFRDEFEVFSREYAGLAPLFINTPEWAKIMERAKEVLRAFDYKESTN